MVVHLTPLKRPQLLDLCGLIESVLRSATASALNNCPSVCSSTADNEKTAQVLPTNGHAVDLGIGGSDASSGSGGRERYVRCEHPLMCGAFCDVFEDPYTESSWRLHDKMLYFVWWSHRPASCSNCGMRDAWLPSADSEMKCWNCGTGAGSTAINDVVEENFDCGNLSDEEEGGPDRSRVDGEVAGGFAASGSNAVVATGGTAVSLYTYFYKWISRLKSMKRLSGICLPRGEALSQVLRSAYDLATLLVLPGTPGSGAMVMWGGSLFLSLTLYRFAVPFPLFQLGGLLCDANETVKTSADNREHIEDLQWVDIELLSSLIGVTLPDFFESFSVGEQYMRNVMTAAAEFGVPSCIWHPRRVPWYQDSILSMKERRRLPVQERGTPPPGDISPEHGAMIALLELARLFDSKPCSSVVAARVGKWLDANGLYPQRTFYLVKDYNTDEPTDGGQQNGVAGVSGSIPLPPAERSAEWVDGPLTTSDSPFRGIMRHVLPSPCANALLYMLADVFSISALELADMARSSGMYGGPTRIFEVLRDSVDSGDYSLAPLARRISPIISPWTSVYFAVHSSDRLPFLSALRLIRVATSREKELHSVRLVQGILRKHQGSRRYQFNYAIDVRGEKTAQQLDGTYFLCYVTDRVAVYAAISSGQRTLTFDTMKKNIVFNSPQMRDVEVKLLHGKPQHPDDRAEQPPTRTLQEDAHYPPHDNDNRHCFQHDPHRQPLSSMQSLTQRDAHGIYVRFIGPVVANVDSCSAKCAIDCTRQELGSVQWQSVVRRLDRCGRVRRRMRVPMLASRLDALASVREPAAMTSHPIGSSSTLFGWGDTENLFGPTPPLLYASPKYTASTLRRELQRDVLSLPRPSLVFGMSENRIVTMYAALIALLEVIDRQLRLRSHASVGIPDGSPTPTWLDELLSVEELDVDSKSSPKAVPTSDTSSHLNGMGDAMMLPTSTATVQRERQKATQPKCSGGQHGVRNGSHLSPQCTIPADAFPSYEEVLLGRVKIIPSNTGGQDVGPRFLRVTRSSKQRRRSGEESLAEHVCDKASTSAAGDPLVLNLASFNLFYSGNMQDTSLPTPLLHRWVQEGAALGDREDTTRARCDHKQCDKGRGNEKEFEERRVTPVVFCTDSKRVRWPLSETKSRFWSQEQHAVIGTSIFQDDPHNNGEVRAVPHCRAVETATTGGAIGSGTPLFWWSHTLGW